MKLRWWIRLWTAVSKAVSRPCSSVNKYLRVEGLRRVSWATLACFFAGGAHDKSRDEHDPPGRDDLEIVRAHFQVLVVEVRQAQAQPAVQVVGGGPLLDDVR